MMKLYAAPDPAHSIAALSNAMLAHYGIQGIHTNRLSLENNLHPHPRNIVLLLLDGLGQNILTTHLAEDSFLRRHQADTLSSVFPPTTVAAATALETGLFPSQSGWLGWNIFWPPLDRNVALYPNTTDNGSQASAEHIGNSYLAVQQLTQAIREQTGIPAVSISEQGDIYGKTLDDVLAEVSRICREPGQHFIYGYVNEPDHTLHRSGCCAEEVRKCLQDANRKLEAMHCPDTLFLLTADHGFIDVDPLCLEDYPELEDTLLRKPSIEPRALNLFLKPGWEQEFLTHWKRIMGDSYILYKKEEAIARQLFGPGPDHPMLEEMLGDYIAVATTPLTLFPNPSYLKFMKATHGGMTPEELTVPLIVWNTNTDTIKEEKLP